LEKMIYKNENKMTMMKKTAKRIICILWQKKCGKILLHSSTTTE